MALPPPPRRWLMGLAWGGPWLLFLTGCTTIEDPGERMRRAFQFNATATALVAAHGFVFWDWGTRAFGVADEGWLQSDTSYGGADKLGHMYSAYAISGISASLYRTWGYSPDRSALYGAGTATAMTTLIELGDGFSREFGFSFEDLLFNGVGAWFEYARRRWRPLGERVQLRWEWLPSRAFREEGDYDFTTDYSGSYYLLAFPLAPWLEGRSGALGWLDLQLGFGTRGYGESAPYFDSAEQETFVGIGLNLTELIRASTGRDNLRPFDYFQVPGTSARW